MGWGWGVNGGGVIVCGDGRQGKGAAADAAGFVACGGSEREGKRMPNEMIQKLLIGFLAALVVFRVVMWFVERAREKGAKPTRKQILANAGAALVELLLIVGLVGVGAMWVGRKLGWW